MGNMDFNEAEKSIKQIIDEMELPEVKYFVDNYLEAYYKTIDESK